MKISHICLLLFVNYMMLCPCRGFHIRNIYGFQYFYKDTEFCDSDWIRSDLYVFRRYIQQHLYGQPFVENIVASAVSSHLKSDHLSKKALTLSFHGLPGTGKNYAATFLAKSIFKKGTESNFYKYYNGRISFPYAVNVQEYKDTLKSDVVAALSACKYTLFVFDEVDMMPTGVLNVLYAFLDYQDNVSGVDPRNAIFIFLSNRGGNDISLKALDLWKKGVKRDNYRLEQFREIIEVAAFNEKGGLQHSDAINGHAISHFIPFLPLEESQVINCIKEEFAIRNKSDLAKDYTKEVLSQVVFTPKESLSGGLYATAGCKNIDTLVGTVIESVLYKAWKKEQQQREEIRGREL